jgi:hypothetical protein
MQFPGRDHAVTFCNLSLGTTAMLISLLEEVASFAAIFLFVTALAFWSNILSTI